MSAELYFYFKKNPLQFIQVSGLNVMVNNEKTFNIKANMEVKYEVTAGICKVQMSMPYLGSETGIAEIELDVKDGERLLLTYKSPITVFTEGVILVNKKNNDDYVNPEDEISNNKKEIGVNDELNKYNEIETIRIQEEKENEERKNEKSKYILELENPKRGKKKRIMKRLVLFALIILLILAPGFLYIRTYTKVPLTELVEERDKGKIEKYLTLGKDIDEVDEYGETALYTAVNNSDEEMVLFLIDKRANTNYIDLLGYSILENAINRGNENIIKYLVENNANVNYKDDEGKSILEVAKKLKDDKIIQYLIENGAK